jgi:hypothetical protein
VPSDQVAGGAGSGIGLSVDRIVTIEHGSNILKVQVGHRDRLLRHRQAVDNVREDGRGYWQRCALADPGLERCNDRFIEYLSDPERCHVGVRLPDLPSSNVRTALRNDRRTELLAEPRATHNLALLVITNDLDVATRLADRSIPLIALDQALPPPKIR